MSNFTQKYWDLHVQISVQKGCAGDVFPAAYQQPAHLLCRSFELVFGVVKCYNILTSCGWGCDMISCLKSHCKSSYKPKHGCCTRKNAVLLQLYGAHGFGCFAAAFDAFNSWFLYGNHLLTCLIWLGIVTHVLEAPKVVFGLHKRLCSLGDLMGLPWLFLFRYHAFGSVSVLFFTWVDVFSCLIWLACVVHSF